MAEKKEEKYIVASNFKDLEDGGKLYKKGDTFPQPANKKISKKRLDELLSKDNKAGKPVIKAADK